MYVFSVLKLSNRKAWGLYASLDDARGALPGVLDDGDGYQIDQLDTDRIGVATMVERGTFDARAGAHPAAHRLAG